MRTPLLAVLAACLLVPAAASAQLPAGPLTAKGTEFVTNFAEHTDSAGAKLLDGYFYVTTERDIAIYDVSKPAAPKKVGSLFFGPLALTNFYYPEEEPDTNGKILITSNEGAIEVIDVRDKTAPKFLAKLPGTPQHAISCVLDCTWAYGSEGSIVDLSDPTAPKLAGNWREQFPNLSRHDVTEVSPGIILTATQPMFVLDAREDPTRPQRLATVGNADKRFNHANRWPNKGQDDFALVGGESIGPNCASKASAAFQTYDTRDWRNSQTFRLVDEFRLSTGLLTDGRMLDSTYCVHWFDEHPTYRNGGLVAISWYEQGTRFLQIGRDGMIKEVGWFVPLGTSASAAYWISDRIVYIADYNRGFDVVRFTGDLPAATTKWKAKRAP